MTIKSPHTFDLDAGNKETDVAYLSYMDDVVTVEIKEDIDMNVPKMRNLLKTAVELAEFKKYFVIVDTRAGFNSAAGVREYYSNNKYSKYRYADAFVINSLSMRYSLISIFLFISLLFLQKHLPIRRWQSNGLMN
jgi:hypothetical protein